MTGGWPRKATLAFAAFGAVSSIPVSASATDLEVTITNLRNDRGFLDVTLYDRSDHWLDDNHAVQNLTLTAHPGSITAVFRDLKPGRYAVVTTHDENGNGRMDFVLGLPAEGYAFSNDVRPFLSAPSFDRAGFAVGARNLGIAIKMVYPFVGNFAKKPR